MSQYDKLRYPKNGPTYTEYFLPKAYAKGFRLASLVDSIWGEFRACKQQLPITDWAMENFVRAVNTLLTDYLPKFGVNRYNSEMFRHCIDISGMYPSIEIDETNI